MASNIVELNTISLLEENLSLSQFINMTFNERKEFIKIISESRLEIYLYNFLKNNDLGYTKINEFSSIKKNSELYTAQTISIVVSTIRLNKILNDAKIEFIFLKGAHLLTRYYRDLSLRPTRDIDILVKPNDIEKLISILIESGYKFEESFNKQYFKSNSQYGYDIPPISDPDGSRIEVHHRIESKVQNQKCKFSLEFFKNKKNYKLSSLDTYFLCDEDLIMHLIYHATKKQGPDVGLIFILDLKKIFSNTNLDLNKLINKSKQYNIYIEFAYVIKIIDIFYDLEIIRELNQMIDIKINQKTLNSLKSLLINNKLNGQEFIMVKAINNFSIFNFLSFYSISSISKKRDLSKNYFLIAFFLVKRFFIHVMIFLVIFTKSIFYRQYYSDLLKNIKIINDFRSDDRD